MRIASFLAVLFLFSADLSALELKGPLIQGGLIIGTAKPGSVVTFEGTRLKSLSNGTFVFGLSRNAPPTIMLKVHTKDGQIQKHLLKVKQRIYRTQRIKGLPRRKVTPSVRDFDRIKRERNLLISVRNSISLRNNFREGFIWPVKGRISGVYGSQRILNGKPRSPHLGVDIAAPLGTTVLASAKGTVALVHQGMFFAGKTIFIDHGLGVGTIYIHLSKILVDKGQKVNQGQLIGLVGKTGRATGSHLHWGLSWNLIGLDPSLLVGPMRLKQD